MKDNGILVWLNFYNGSVDFFGCDVYEFDSMVEYIDFDTSKTKETCFCQLGNERILYSLDFNQIPGLRRKYNPEEEEIVDEVVRKIYRFQFKRKQCCLGVRLTERAFCAGVDLPIIQRFY